MIIELGKVTAETKQHGPPPATDNPHALGDLP
jgi:hypothetical protein